MELIRARMEVRVENLPARSCILPLLILSFELVAKADPSGDSETCGGEGYLQVGNFRWKSQRSRVVVLPAVSDNRRNQYGRWHRIPDNTLGVDPSYSFGCCEPNP